MPWRTGSRVRWAPQLTFQPAFFPQFFALSAEVGAAIACKSAASGDPRPFVPVWRADATMKPGLELTLKLGFPDTVGARS